jgi:ornithine cyclodeaminase
LLILAADEIRRAVSMEQVMEAVELALREFSLGRAIAPVRMSVPVASERAAALFMPAFVEAAGGLGIKFVSVFPNNRSRGKKTIHGVQILADPSTGEPLAVLEASYLTVLRTGAAVGVAARYLARDDARTLAVIGTGAQARGMVEALCVARRIESIRLYNRTPAKAHEFALILRTQWGLDAPEIVIASSADEAVEGADIVATATTSTQPVFTAEAVGPGVTIVAVGSFTPEMQELPSGVIRIADKVVVESREAALHEAGDLIIPIQEGLFRPELVHAELGEIAAGIKPGREQPEEITVFKSVGLSVMDVVVGKLVYDRARGLGIGQEVRL